MGWAEFFLIDMAVLIAALLYWRNRPKPKWLLMEIAIAKAIARFLRIIKRVRAKARI